MKKRSATIGTICWLLLSVGTAGADATGELRQQLEADLTVLQGLVGLEETELRQALESRMTDRLDARTLTRRAFGSYVERSLADYDRALRPKDLRQLVTISEEQLAATCRRRAFADLAAHLRGGVREIRLQGVQAEADTGTAYLEVDLSSGPVPAVSTWSRSEDAWRLVDLEVNGQRLSHRLRELAGEAVTRELSLPVVVARLTGSEYIVLEDFTTTPPGKPPVGWSLIWKDKDEGKPRHYLVQEANGKRYLEARDEGSSVIIGKFMRWNPREYPIMTWCWRTTVLPEGADERRNELNDSAGGIFVVFSFNWLLHTPKQLKYVWSTTLPVGTVDRRNKPLRPWFFVVESGGERLGRWTFEQVDLLRDYQLKLGDQPAERTVSIQVLTDANSTHSRAAADYADLRVWRRDAAERGLIHDYCDCLEAGPTRP
ncbi:MAG: DUF3047 domain-containing protein [Candidatus Latescibacterota bacterium]|jgi:hypothetical protein